MDSQSTVPAAVGPLVRRWPWAVGAAVLGAAAGGAIARLVRRVEGVDAPDAQDPAELEAVVDRARPPAPVTPPPETPAPDAPAPVPPASDAAPTQVANPLSAGPLER